MVFKIDTKFEGKLTCVSKNDMRNFMASFCPELKMYELKIYRGVMCHDNDK